MSGCSVVVLAAGKGTRMKSELPKVLHDLCGRSLLGHAISAANGVDPQQIVAVVRHDRDRVAAEAKRVFPDVLIADQDELPGTGRAAQCALEAAAAQGVELGETVVITSGDVPLLESQTLRALIRKHEDNGAVATVLTTIAPDPTGYGRIVREDGRLVRIVEHRDATTEELAISEVNAGIYAFNTRFLTEALSGLGTDNDQGELYLTDVVQVADQNGDLAQPFLLEDAWQAEGCNDLVQLAALRKELNKRLLEKYMRLGAQVVDPDSTHIDVDVVLQPDCRIEPFTILRGKSIVGSGAVAGPFELVQNKELFPGLQ